MAYWQAEPSPGFLFQGYGVPEHVVGGWDWFLKYLAVWPLVSWSFCWPAGVCVPWVSCSCLLPQLLPSSPDYVVCALEVWTLCFPQPSGTPESKPHCHSIPDALGAHLPGAGLLSWRAWIGVWTSHSFGSVSAVVTILLFVKLLLGGIGLDYIMTQSLLPLSIWFLLCICGCRRSFPVGSSLFLIYDFFSNCCDGVPVRRGQLRVFSSTYLAHLPCR